LAPREFGQANDVIRTDGNAFRKPGYACIAGRAVYFFGLRALRKLPHKGVLASPAANDQDLHANGIY
jgi:hypothetical protein